MRSVGAQPDVVKLSEYVLAWVAGARQAYVGWLQQQLQAHVDRVVRAQVGRGRGERERPDAAARSAWRCSRCGRQRRCDFNYSGSYRRRLALAQGWIELRIPRLRCRCGGNVRADFGALLPARQRLWYDLILAVLELLRGGGGAVAGCDSSGARLGPPGRICMCHEVRPREEPLVRGGRGGVVSDRQG